MESALRTDPLGASWSYDGRGTAMRKVWEIDLDGQRHRIDVAWDVQLSGGGRIVLDGVIADTWWIGVKFPGVSRQFMVGRQRAQVRTRWMDFDLYLGSARVPDQQLVEIGGNQPGGAPHRLVALGLLIVVLAVLLLAAWWAYALGTAP